MCVGVGFIWLLVDLFLIPGMVREANAPFPNAFGGLGGSQAADVESSNQNAQNIVINVSAPVAEVRPGVPDQKNEPSPESPFPGVADRANPTAGVPRPAGH